MNVHVYSHCYAVAKCSGCMCYTDQSTSLVVVITSKIPSGCAKTATLDVSDVTST